MPSNLLLSWDASRLKAWRKVCVHESPPSIRKVHDCLRGYLIYGDDPCPERNVFTKQAMLIARTIEDLMVGQDDIG